MKRILLISLFFFMTSGISGTSAGDTETLDAILHADISVRELIASDTYRAQRDKIREELVAKLKRMIREDEYRKILDYLFLIVDISDRRYVPLLKTMEKRLGSSAGVNLVGYSEFLELKISNVAGEAMIEKILRPDVGEYLFYDVSEYVLSESVSFDEKLMKFKMMSEKVGFRYMHVILPLVRKLCSENMTKTQKFFNRHGEFRNRVGYDCVTEKYGP